MASENNPGPFTTALTALGNGLLANPPGGVTTVVVDGTAVAVTALAAEVKSYEAIWVDVETTNLAHVQAVQERTKVEPTVLPRVAKIVVAVKGMLGPTNPALETLYGITPDKEPQPLTAEKQVAKNAQSLATRKARGTLGKRQKAAIKGVVPAPAAAPAVAATKTSS
jgi:hypothetical protein